MTAFGCRFNRSIVTEASPRNGAVSMVNKLQITDFDLQLVLCSRVAEFIQQNNCATEGARKRLG